MEFMRTTGVARDTFYRVNEAKDSGGLEALARDRCHPARRSALPGTCAVRTATADRVPGRLLRQLILVRNWTEGSRSHFRNSLDFTGCALGACNALASGSVRR